MRFTIEGTYFKEKTFPSLNDYIHQLGTNPRAGGKLKKDYMFIACNVIRRSLKRQKVKGAVILHYKFYEPKKGQKRDRMNVFAFADKVIEDALQECKVIANDSPEYILNTSHEFYYSDKPRIEVEIEEVDNESFQ